MNVTQRQARCRTAFARALATLPAHRAQAQAEERRVLAEARCRARHAAYVAEMRRPLEH